MSWKKALVAVPMSAALLFGTGGGMISADEMQKPSVDTSAVDLRANLGNLLSEHAFLAVEAMRKGAEDTGDFKQAAAVLSENTDDLTDAITSVYGEDAGQQFNDIWSTHVGYFVDYVNATADEDEEAKQKALDNLADYKKDFSEFLEGATNERIEASSLAEGLQKHIGQLIGAFDSYVAGDYEAAYTHEREAIEHMHTVAKGLSSAITDQFPDKYNQTMPATPAGDLREDLGYLLSEHAGLAVSVMQNGINGSEDFDASAKVLSKNTDDLTAAITDVYGEEAGDAFKEIWSNHIGYFVDYVNATAEDNADAKEEALNQLQGYKKDFSTFMEDATDGEVPAEDLAKGLQTHADQLINSFDSYADDDYEAAFSTERDAYHHMYSAAKLLSSGIVAQNPDKFAAEMPSDMPTTGYAPADNNSHMMIWMIGVFALAIATFTAVRKYQQSK